MTSGQQAADKVQQAVANAVGDGVMDVVHHAFDSLIVEQEHRKIDEPTFRGHFLPWFLGNKEVPQGRNPLIEWIGVAGSPTAAVDVVAANGETLFTVPAVMDSSVLQIRGTPGMSLKDMIEQYKLYGDHTPGAAASFYRKHIEGKADALAPKHSDMTKAEQQWVKIFDHYNVTPPEVAAQQQEAVETKAAQSNAEDDMSF